MVTTTVDPERSRVMRAVKSTNTTPERLVRRLATALGHRYRLHRKDLPGKPDLVFTARKKALFVHGCFWHGHHCARGARVPVNNREYWLTKIARNRRRDRKAQRALREQGWSVGILWECQLKDPHRASRLLATFLRLRP